MKTLHRYVVKLLLVVSIGLGLKYINWMGVYPEKYNRQDIKYTACIPNNVTEKRKAHYTNFCDGKLEEGDSRPIFLLGIISKADHRTLRDLHRKYLRARLGSSFRFVMCFLLDLPTADVLLESKEKRDIVILNSYYSGKAHGFGEKLHRWYQFAFYEFPSVRLVGKMDDDAYVCAPDTFDVLNNVSSPRLYFGWQHAYDVKTVENSFLSGRSEIYSNGVSHRHDAMFVVIGRELVHRIMERGYCSGRNCNSSVDLVERGHGGSSLGTWLSIYSDIIQIAQNPRIVHGPKILEKYLNPSFCEAYLILHPVKSTKDMEKMYSFRKQ